MIIDEWFTESSLKFGLRRSHILCEVRDKLGIQIFQDPMLSKHSPNQSSIIPSWIDSGTFAIGNPFYLNISSIKEPIRPDHFLFCQFWLLAILPELSITFPFCAFTIFCCVLWSLLERLLFISLLTTLLLLKTHCHVYSLLY